MGLPHQDNSVCHKRQYNECYKVKTMPLKSQGDFVYFYFVALLLDLTIPTFS